MDLQQLHQPTPAALKQLMQWAVAPWCAEGHEAWPRSFRQAVFVVMCVAHRLGRRAVSASASASAREGTAAVAVFKIKPGRVRSRRVALPRVLWHEILSFCAREDWYGVIG